LIIGTRIAVASFMTAAALVLWVGGVKLMGSIGLDAWRRVGERWQALVTLVVLALPVLVAPALARAAMSAIQPNVAFLTRPAIIWFGCSLAIVCVALIALLLIGLDEGIAARIAVAAVFVAALVSAFAGLPRDPVARSGAPQNNKMQQTRHG
jgi:hypothetical protein